MFECCAAGCQVDAVYKALTEDLGPIVPNQTWTDQCKPCIGIDGIADRQFGSSAEEVGAAHAAEQQKPLIY